MMHLLRVKMSSVHWSHVTLTKFPFAIYHECKLKKLILVISMTLGKNLKNFEKFVIDLRKEQHSSQSNYLF